MRISIKKTALVLFFLAAANAWSQKVDALDLYREGKNKEAIAVCEGELEKNPNNMESYCVLCWALIENRQYGEAERRATEASRKENADYRITQVLGEAKYNLGKYKEALSLFQRYIVRAPESHGRIGRTYYYMGEIYIRLAQYQHADIALSTAVRKDSLKDFWWQRLGYCREQTGDWKNAIAAYDQALKLNPSQTDAKTGRERCLSHIRIR